MKNQKSTKKTLLTSVLSLILCIALLIGTTFAWFTDNVTSANNKIVAGNLDVQLLMNTGDGYKDISDSTSPIFGSGSVAQNNNAETRWEPGKTQIAYLAIKNNGNLALKYSVALDVENVSKNLYEVMEYAITPDAQYDAKPAWEAEKAKAVVEGLQSVVNGDVSLAVGATHYFALSIHMQETAGNEYMNGEVNFDLTVLATQDTVEADSFNNQYDKDAKNPSIVRTASDLVTALRSGGDVVLGTDVAVDGNLSLAAGATFNGNGYELSDVQLYMSEGSTVENVVFDGTEAANGSQIYAHNASVTIKDCVFNSPAWDAIQATAGTVDDCTIVIDGCTFTSDAGAAYRYVHVEISENELYADNDVKVVLTNNYFKNIDKCTDDGITIAGIFEENVTVSGNTASAASEAAATAECWLGSKETGSWVKYDVDVFEKVNLVVENTTAFTNSIEEAVANGETDITIDAEGAVLDLNYGLDKNLVPAGTTVTIANATVADQSYGNGVDGTVVFENCTFENPNGAYSIHFDSGSGNVIFNNCVLSGWCSFGSAIQSVELNNCTIKGNGIYAMTRFFQDTALNNCVIDCSNAPHDDKWPDAISAVNGATVTLTDCELVYCDLEVAENAKIVSDGVTLLESVDNSEPFIKNEDRVK